MTQGCSGRPREIEGITNAGKDRLDEAEELLTAREVKERLRCGLSTVYELLAAGRLKGFRLRGDKGGIRIYASSVARMIAGEAKPMAPPPPPPAPAGRRRGRPRKILHYSDLALSDAPRRSS
jgi:excisionase family DNA binding protein